MPISSFTDYIPTMDEFISHWAATDDNLKVAEGEGVITFDSFNDLRAELDQLKSTLQTDLNDWENARVVLEQTRQTAGDRVAEFNRRIRADFPNNKLFNQLPAVPNRTAGREAFMTALDDVLDLWTRVNAQPPSPIFSAPLLLPGGFTRAQCVTLRAAVDSAFTTRGDAERAVNATRLKRNALQDRVFSIMKQYRLKIEALYAADSVEVLTLPRLSPLPGHTPDPVELTGTYDAADARAELSWTASDEAELASYELRSVPGPDYVSEDESTLASIPPGGPLTFTTAAGFSLPGNAVSYKIYVRLTTGNEAGSEAVTVTRPF
jgi:hypothetical protein